MWYETLMTRSVATSKSISMSSCMTAVTPTYGVHNPEISPLKSHPESSDPAAPVILSEPQKKHQKISAKNSTLHQHHTTHRNVHSHPHLAKSEPNNSFHSGREESQKYYWRKKKNPTKLPQWPAQTPPLLVNTPPPPSTHLPLFGTYLLTTNPCLSSPLPI